MLVKRKSKDINLIPDASPSADLSKAILPLVIFVVILLGLVGVGAFVFVSVNQERSKNKDLENQLVTKNQEWQALASTSAQIASIKTKVAAVQGFSKTYPPMETYLSNLAKSLPTSIVLVSVDVDNSGRATVQAKASTSASAYQFVNTLEAETTKFSAVKLTALSRSTEVEEYTLSLSLQIAR